jgi:hypothetical protein
MNIIYLPKKLLADIGSLRETIKASIKRTAQYTPERLEEIKELNKARNSPIVDHRTCLDYNFDLHAGKLIIGGKEFTVHQVSISKGQLDPMEKVNLPKTFTSTIPRASKLKKFAANIMEYWVEQYGAVMFGSNSETKFDSYMHILVIMASQKGLGVTQFGPNFSLFFDANSSSALELVNAFKQVALPKEEFPNDEG